MIDLVSIISESWKPPADTNALAEEVEARLSAAPTALGRATALAAWKKLWEHAHPNRRRGGDRKSASFQAAEKSNSNFWTLIGARLKLGRSSILADVALAEKLGHDDVARLWDSPICNDGQALRGFAALQPPQRDRVYEALRAHPDRSWDDHLTALRLKTARDGGDDAAFERLCGAWRVAPARVRRRFLAEIGITNKRLIDNVARNSTTEAS